MIEENFMRLKRVAGVMSLGVVLVVLMGAVPVLAAPAPWWLVQSVSSPSYLPLGGEGKILVTVENVGDGAVEGGSVPVRIADKLPPGLEVTGMSAVAGGVSIAGGDIRGSTYFGGVVCRVAEVSCTWTEAPVERGSGGPLGSYEPIEVVISVKNKGAVSGDSWISVSGGQVQGSAAGVQPVSVHRPITVSGTPTPFGVEEYGFRPEEEGGLPDVQAGSHPFQLTSVFSLHQTADLLAPPALVRDLGFALPAGLIGNATVTPQCTEAQFLTVEEENTDLCPSDTAIGAASVTLIILQFAPDTVMSTVPVFNLVPSPGEPARFGFYVEKVSVILDSAVRTGGDYGVTVTSRNTTQVASLVSTRLTFWGVPGDARHDSARGWSCIDDGHYSKALPGAIPPCVPEGVSAPRPFLTLPTSCTGPLRTSLSLTSWPTRQDPGGITPEPFAAGEPGAGLTGCERLRFDPELSVTPDARAGDTPTGLETDVHIPVLENPEGLAEGNMKKAVVTLPAGVVVNPGAANGLGACTPEEIGLDNANPVSCPESAKVGTAEALSPSLKAPLTGSVYVAQQGSNPFGSLLAVYLVVEGEGVLIKSAGEVHLDPVTGQVTTTFDNIPQQATSDIRLHFFGGPHATLTTPTACGTYTTTSKLTPYNTDTPAEPSSAFQITSGPNGSGCGPEGFAPSFTAGMVNNQAGGFSPFSVTFSRQDQDQGLGSLTVKTPAGLLGLLKSVQQCGEPQAAQGTCGAGSLIGHATATAGAGPDPVSVTGQVFLTGPYNGAPYGLSVVVPAAVGPFNLGNVVVRSAIHIDPRTAQITVTSDPFPTILQGIPLQLRTVNVSIDRTGFMFNPTSCDPQTVAGSIASTQGATTAVSSRFQAANCAALAFKPVFTVSTQAATSKKNGASLDVKTSYPAGSANIRSVAVTLPKQLPSRLSTIQQACPEATFNQNPAGCPAGSVIGTGTATTPVLANPLTGPAFLVSHGGAAFPDLVLILQGERVTVELVGSINIKHGITSSTFANVPDAPISGFELRLPEGSHSGLAAVLPASARGNLCGSSLTMPTTITGQNGAQVKQSTKIKVTGCPAAKKKPKAKKTKKKGRKK